ncbi:MAG TPA: phosphoribosylformylglycinamidine synthase subunit PurL [Deltaproteobacteria bacterium]|nr:phosphoribosylformylglycinamidine synthase subunit PurL [Deltaproteobacteria bacterium]
MKISEETVRDHGLTAGEYGKIVEVLGREPNLVELGIFSVMWSEHCSYKSSRVHLRNFPTEAPHVIQGPGENAGVVDIGGGLAVVFKMESHNHPSFIEPYQGAATGVGGILRDIFTMGARPVASLNSLRFGSTENPRTRYLFEGVVAGIAGYGNCMGVPTVGGEVSFHESYDGNCLVNAMTVGVAKRDAIFLGRAAGPGNPVIYVGSKTGRDGIHGAVMASDVFGEGGEERRPTVQVGDPFTEKLLLEACLEAFRTDYIVGIQDMGAAGLTSSSVEMASRGGAGIEIDVSRVPRREEGMNAYEVMLSESQERMLIVARRGCEGPLMEIFRKWDLEAAVIGEVTDTGRVVVRDGGNVEADIPVDALTDAAPVYDRPAARPPSHDGAARLDTAGLPVPDDLGAALVTLMGSLNIASKRWVYRQYDHTVRTDTVVSPGSDAAVLRIKGTKKGLALTVDCNSRYCYLDPYRGGAAAVVEAARNLAVSGARALAVTDCLNFGNPERPEVMWQFRESIRGMSDACRALGVPVVSGNVSFYNETSGRSVYPTPTVGMVGLLDDVESRTVQWFSREGDVIVLLGDAEPTLGASEYLKVVHGVDAGMPPGPDLEGERSLHALCVEAAALRLLRSAHDLSDGGLAVALAEACMSPGGPLGAVVEIDGGSMRPDALLFGEGHGRVVASAAPGDVESLRGLCARAGVPFTVIGRVGGDRLRINDLVDVAVKDVEKAWSGAVEAFAGR